MIALALFVNLALPLLFVLWMAGPWVTSRLEGIVLAVMAASFAVFVFLAGPIWSWIGLWVRWVPLGVLAMGLVVMALHWPARPWLPSGGWRGWVSIALKTAIAAFFALQVAISVAGHRAPGTPVNIAMPVEPGEYLVLNGGSTLSLNHHHAVRAQRYAIDVVALEDGARRADGLRPVAMEQYAIYGRAIIAPCSGTVLSTSDGAPDTPIGGSDDNAPAGNYVSLSCEVDGAPLTVMLAHLVPGSVAVAPGKEVATGDVLGRVGSSGNSSEPHLHIHAVQGEVRDLDDLIRTAEPVPLAIGGDFLVRNETFGVAR